MMMLLRIPKTYLTWRAERPIYGVRVRQQESSRAEPPLSVILGLTLDRGGSNTPLP